MIRLFALLFVLLSATCFADSEFTLPPLPYPADALEPHMDSATMIVHHSAHHQGYVNNLNKAVSDHPQLEGKSLDEILSMVSQYPATLRNNAGGHYNHLLFWQVMAPEGEGGEPSAALSAAIERDFGSVDVMRERLSQAAVSTFGSGWAWLVLDQDGKLQVGSSANQDNPLMDDSDMAGTPVLGIDVWEHAYYLKHKNRRGDYVSAFWNVVNWNEVNRRFDEAYSDIKD